MTLEERRLAVGILLSLTLALRMLAMFQARGWEHGDGIRREGFGLGVVFRLLVFVVGLGGSLLWIAWPSALPLPIAVPGWLSFSALVAAEAGLILLMSVHLSLGVHFSGTLHLRQDHRLVEIGPYRWIRHPMYTSFLLLLGGLAILIGDLLVGAVFAASQVWVLCVRLKDEEAMMAERFGADWERFRSRRGALLPRLR
jgi:protein-S-isoprenylcysteine O-methyltransferase Ste14